MSSFRHFSYDRIIIVLIGSIYCKIGNKGWDRPPMIGILTYQQYTCTTTSGLSKHFSCN